MIDLKKEEPLSLAQAARLIPPTRLDKKVHVSTLVRWILHGVRGVRLEAIRVGGRWVTTREAIGRFSADLTAGHLSPSTQPTRPALSTVSARRREQDRVEREELEALGLEA